MKKHVREAYQHAQAVLHQRKKFGDEIPRFSRKHATIADYLKSKEFRESKPEYQRRVIKQAHEHPHWTLAEARGHSPDLKPTDKSWKAFDAEGKFPDRVIFKNVKEQSKYAEYAAAVGKTLETGDVKALKDWQKRWKGAAKEFKLLDGTKFKPVTDVETLVRLHEFNELPTGDEIYGLAS